MDALEIRIEQKAVSSLNLEEAGAALIAAMETGTRVIEVEAEVDADIEALPEGVVVEVTAEEETQEVADVAVEEGAAAARAAGAEGEKSESCAINGRNWISSFYLIKPIINLISYSY